MCQTHGDDEWWLQRNSKRAIESAAGAGREFAEKLSPIIVDAEASPHHDVLYEGRTPGNPDSRCESPLASRQSGVAYASGLDCRRQILHFHRMFLSHGRAAQANQTYPKQRLLMDAHASVRRYLQEHLHILFLIPTLNESEIFRRGPPDIDEVRANWAPPCGDAFRPAFSMASTTR